MAVRRPRPRRASARCRRWWRAACSWP